MTVAAIDCGTNSIRLLVLAGSRDAPQELAREVRLARLGQGVDATREFHPDALARTFAVCDEFAQIIRAHGAEKVRFVATSAARDVTNRQLLIDGVRERLGVEMDVIPGQEEARLSSAGALCGCDPADPDPRHRRRLDGAGAGRWGRDDRALRLPQRRFRAAP